jgi:hypothetical protein
MAVGGMASLFGSMKIGCFAVVVCRSAETSLEPKAFGRFTRLILGTVDFDWVLESLELPKQKNDDSDMCGSRILAAK